MKVNGKRRESDPCPGECDSDTESSAVKPDIVGGNCSHDEGEKADQSKQCSM